MAKNSSTLNLESEPKPKKMTRAQAAAALDELNEVLAKNLEEIRERQTRTKILQEETNKSIAQTREMLLKL